MANQEVLASRRGLHIRRQVITYFVATTLAVFFIFPFFWMIVGSLKDFRGFYDYPPSFLPVPAYWSNYAVVVDLIPLFRYVLNTLFIAAAITVCQLISSSTAGFAFATLQFRGREFLFMTFLAGLMVPFTVVLIPLFLIIRLLGLIDTYVALILPFVFTPFGVFLMRQFFMGLPLSLFDSAKIDGASPFGIYARIYLPLSGPVMATLGILAFVFFYNNLIWPLIVINTESLKTVSVGLLSFTGREGTSPHLIMAGATVSVVPTIVLFILLQKYFVEGITMTGLKG
jgi:multiple sugar transport system permease protein